MNTFIMNRTAKEIAVSLQGVLGRTYDVCLVSRAFKYTKTVTGVVIIHLSVLRRLVYIPLPGN
jgi:hypothetical protein